jgi:ABC-type transporter Mla subunit MlaD
VAQRIVERNQMIEAQTERLDQTATKASATLVEIAKQVDEAGLGVAAAGDAAGATLRDVGGQFRQHVQDLAATVDQTVGRMQAARDVLNSHFAAIGDAAGSVTLRLEELCGQAREQVASFAAASDAMLQHRDDTGEQVQRQILEINNMLEQANSRLDSARGVLRSQAAELNAATDLTVERLRDISEIYHNQSAALVGAAEQAGGRAKEASEVFRTHTQTFLKAANDAATLAQRMRDQAQSNQADTFLKSATFIIETLQSLSVDLARILDQPVPETIWKRFHAGERGVFARYILQLQDRQSSTIIKEKFEGDSGFREQALRYMDQFEQLLAQARAVDRADVMGATFVTADVGKLYLVMANALGRPTQ